MRVTHLCLEMHETRCNTVYMQFSHRFESIQQNIGKIMRALRKEQGMSQKEMATFVGLSQSDVSRLESGKQSMSLCDWLAYCEKMGIMADSAKIGYYERPSKTKLLDLNDPNPFKLPRKYLRDRGSKVRSSKLYMNFFTLSSGEAEVQKFLEFHKVDPDFFMNLDNQINASFPLSVFAMLVTKRKVNKDNVQRMAAAITNPSTHGHIHHKYEDIEKSITLIKALVNNIKFYDANFDYRISDQTADTIDITIAPNAHMVGIIKKMPEIEDGICHYLKSVFLSFSSYGGKAPLKIQEKECLYRGGKKCAYHFHT